MDKIHALEKNEMWDITIPPEGKKMIGVNGSQCQVQS